jgi:SAM-dependent methyltransferase
MSKREQWNQRYGSAELVWGAEPNQFLAAELGGVEGSGRVLDLACGEGRNAIWLAERGFEVTAVDFSGVAIERARKLASDRGVEVEWICDDVTRYEPPPSAFDRVVILYLQVPRDDFQRALEHAATALAPGGKLLMIGHALRNLTDGVGGPQQAEVLWDPEALRAELTTLGLEVERADEVVRSVEGKGDAIDVLIRARRTG